MHVMTTEIFNTADIATVKADDGIWAAFMFDKSKAAHSFIHKALCMRLPAHKASVALTTLFLAGTVLLPSGSVSGLDGPAGWG